HENLHKVMAMDCLANKGVLDYSHQYREGYSPGSDESAAWVNCYIKSFSTYYGSRTALADVALVFPGQSLLAGVSVFTLDAEKRLHDYLGWAQALTDLHFQWDVLLDDQLRLDRLKRFKVVVLPGAACLSDEAIAALVAYLDGGGRLVISGEAGTRHGIERFLWYRDPKTTLAARIPGVADASPPSGPSHHTACFLCPESPGKTYYEDVADGERLDGRLRIHEAIEHGLAETTAQLETDAPATVGVFAFREQDGAVAVDLVNYDVDPPTDRLTRAKAVGLIVHPPAGKSFSGPRATLVSPDLRVAADSSDVEKPPTPWRYPPVPLDGRLRADGALEITVPPFTVFSTVSAPVR
ncbi:MAG: hypothetical protein HQ581_04660, partial [Planctomycetes bacterium]|nr:hypothetical protein [Planctomycetota bacterium]